MSKIEIPVVVGKNVATETTLPACRVLVVSGIESGAGKSTFSRHFLKPLMLDLRFPRFFVCHQADFMLPIFPDSASLPNI